MLDLNTAAQKILGVGPAVIGRPAGEALASIRHELRLDELGEQTHFQQVIHPRDPGRRLDIVITPLARKLDDRPGRVVVLRDAAPTGEGAVPTGIVPMCASCRRVRDEAGDWYTLEHYFERNSGIRFSHGLCDECLRRLYPGFDIGRPRKE